MFFQCFFVVCLIAFYNKLTSCETIMSKSLVFSFTYVLFLLGLCYLYLCNIICFLKKSSVNKARHSFQFTHSFLLSCLHVFMLIK
uniref:Secreted protein n=1 Tax=Panstrongylus lignarius TaxID=156445 RepID=A0A224XW10_9HEMI